MATKEKTRKDEVTIKTLDLAKMYNQFLTHDILRTWHEEYVDQDTQETVTIQRTEVILQKGVCLNNENLAKLNFHIQCGDITEPIEVSNQSRLASEVEYRKYPYYCKVNARGGTIKFLLEAKGVAQALDIVRDWCELKYSGQFSIQEVKTYDNAVILIDRLRNYPADKALEKYKQGEISFAGFMDEDIEDYEYVKPSEKDDYTSIKFYQIRAAIIYDGEREFGTSLFVVLATDADRAILTINAYLQQKQHERNTKTIHEGRKDNIDTRAITATIEESKIVNFSRLIPDSFCKAYYDCKE